MNKSQLEHQLLYAWEPKNSSNHGKHHIYDRWISNDPSSVVIHDNKYLCGLVISDMSDLKNFTLTDYLTHNIPELQKNFLCPDCNKILNDKFPLQE